MCKAKISVTYCLLQTQNHPHHQQQQQHQSAQQQQQQELDPLKTKILSELEEKVEKEILEEFEQKHSNKKVRTKKLVENGHGDEMAGDDLNQLAQEETDGWELHY